MQGRSRAAIAIESTALSAGATATAQSDDGHLEAQVVMPIVHAGLNAWRGRLLADATLKGVARDPGPLQLWIMIGVTMTMVAAGRHGQEEHTLDSGALRSNRTPFGRL